MQFDEIFDSVGDGLKETGGKVKTFLKKNPFIILCIVVGAIALILWYIRERNAAAASGDSGMYYEGEQAIGYGGYPSGSGESVDGEYWQTAITNLEDKYAEALGLVTEKHDLDIDYLNQSWSDRYDSLLDKMDNMSYGGGGGGTPIVVAFGSGQMESFDDQELTAREEYSIITRMKENSNAYNLTSSAEQRAALHEENQMLGSAIGATYDSATGTWWMGDTALYSLYDGTFDSSVTYVEGTTGTEKGYSNYVRDGSTIASNGAALTYATPVNAISFRDTTRTSGVSYDSNVDYQARILAALEHGETAKANTYQAQRDAKIADSGKPVTVTYNKDVDYQALINKAKETGASDAVIANLTAQREAKIKGENLTQYK